MKKYFLVFILAFVLNFVWENLHSFLYIYYQGGNIGEYVLFRAAFWDAVIILGMIFFLRLTLFLKNQSWILIFVGIIIAIIVEKFALATGRWQYKDIMPIIPYLNTGLTPTIQLGFLAYLTHKIIFRKKRA